MPARASFLSACRIFLLNLMIVFSLSNMSAQAEDQFPTNPIVYNYPSNRLVQIDPSLLGQCMAWVSKSPSAQPSIQKDSTNGGFSMEAFVSYLEAAQDRKYDFRTPHEAALKSWILAQPDNSIDPLAIYTEAIQLSRGDVWDAILTIHDLLRNNARFYDRKRYFYDTDLPSADRFWNKFIDIRGDLKERGKGFNGDHAGSWYRIWGTMLYRLMWEDDRAPSSSVTNSCGITGKAESLFKTQMRDWLPLVVSDYAEWVKAKRTDEKDSKKAEINRDGAEAMNHFLETLWPVIGDPKVASPKNLQDCKNRDYLKSAQK